jgi:MFS family permease
MRASPPPGATEETLIAAPPAPAYVPPVDTSGFWTRIARFRTFEALQYRDFRLLWFGQFGNAAGQWMDQVTRGWLMYQLTDSALQLGLVSAVRAIPLLFFSVVAGAVADRYGRKTQLVIAQVTNALLNLLLGVLVITRHIEPWHLYATGVLAGSVQAFQNPARQSMVSDVVSRERLANAIGLNSMAFNLSRTLAPAVAGILIATIGTEGSYLSQAMMYFVATYWTLQLRVPEGSARHGAGRHGAQASMWSSTGEGARYIWHNPTIRTVMLVVLVPSLLGQPFTSLIPVFARDILQVGPQGQGLFFTAIGLGALAGSVVVATLGHTGRPGLFMLGSALLFALTIIGFAAAPSFGVALAFMAINGLCNVTYGTQAQTLLQLETPQELRGRVLGIYMMDRGLTPIGALLFGSVASALGAPMAVTVLGSICAALALWAFISAPALRARGRETVAAS